METEKKVGHSGVVVALSHQPRGIDRADLHDSGALT